jgi:hypothetical protein
MTVPLIIKEPRFDRMFLRKIHKVCPKAKQQLDRLFEGLNTSYNSLAGPVYKELSRNSLDPAYFEVEKVRAKIFHLRKNKKNGNQKKAMWNLRNAALWYDMLQSEVNWFGVPPYKISDELVGKLKKVQSAYLFGQLATDDLRMMYTTEIASVIKNELLFHNEQAIVEENKKGEKVYGFTVAPDRIPLKYLGFSAEDMGLSAFLMALDLVDGNCNIKAIMNTEVKGEPCLESPDSAANLRIELSKRHKKDKKYPEYFVRTFYNNKSFKFCRSQEDEYCKLEDFIGLFDSQTITRHEGSICGAKNSVVAPNYHFVVIIVLLIVMIFWMRGKVVEEEEKIELVKTYSY